MESDALKRILLACGGKDAVTLWRNNTGQAWSGNPITRADNAVIIRNPYMVRYGLCVGSSDLIGFKTVTVTPDMVGKKIAIFCALEVKKNEKSKKSADQERFINHIVDNGGKAGFTTSPESAKKILELKQ